MTYRPFILSALLATFVLSACEDAHDAPDSGSVAESEHDHDADAGEEHSGGDHTEDGHAAHDEHGDEGHHDEDHGFEDHSDHVELSQAAAREAGIVVTRAAYAPTRQTLLLPAELRYDADRVALVSAPVSGRIAELFAREGDLVSRGDTLAILTSREFAELKADYLTAQSAEHLARQSLAREETLFADRITSEADLQTARAAHIAARAERESAQSRLLAVGLSSDEFESLLAASSRPLADVRLSAPIGGIIAQRTATLGAAVSGDDAGAAALFTIVEDSVLWADIAVYQHDAGSVDVGEVAVLIAQDGARLAEGEVATVLPAIDESSRTATARVVVENPDRRMRPGQLVTAEILTGSSEPSVQVPSAAIVNVEGRTSVFVPTDDGFEPRQVSIGATFGDVTVILSGLSAGDAFVSAGAFTLKAQLEKDAFGDGDDH